MRKLSRIVLCAAVLAAASGEVRADEESVRTVQFKNHVDLLQPYLQGAGRFGCLALGYHFTVLRFGLLRTGGIGLGWGLWNEGSKSFSGWLVTVPLADIQLSEYEDEANLHLSIKALYNASRGGVGGTVGFTFSW